MLLHQLIWLMGGDAGELGLMWDTADKTAGMTLSNGDLTAASPNNTVYEHIRTTRKNFNTANGGKYYWEFNADSVISGDVYIGLYSAATVLVQNTVYSGLAGAPKYAIWRNNGSQAVSGWGGAGGASPGFSTGNRGMFALDVPAGKLFIGSGGTWNNSANPAAGTNPQFTGMPSSHDFAFFFSTDNNAGANTITLIEAGDIDFTPPSGFTAI